MIQPLDFTVKTQAGDERVYVLSKFPAVAGREIIAKYPMSGMPKLGDYNVNEETMLKLMAFVSARLPDGNELPLSTKVLVDNHVPDWETLARIEIEMMGYNCSFFANGKISSFFDNLKAKVDLWTSSTLTDLLGQLSEAIKQASKNSEQSTP
jgi:hypothetical protein